jgi:hypothetical protein
VGFVRALVTASADRYSNTSTTVPSTACIPLANRSVARFFRSEHPEMLANGGQQTIVHSWLRKAVITHSKVLSTEYSVLATP